MPKRSKKWVLVGSARLDRDGYSWMATLRPTPTIPTIPTIPNVLLIYHAKQRHWPSKSKVQECKIPLHQPAKIMFLIDMSKLMPPFFITHRHTQAHTQTHIYLYIYTHIVVNVFIKLFLSIYAFIYLLIIHLHSVCSTHHLRVFMHRELLRADRCWRILWPQHNMSRQAVQSGGDAGKIMGVRMPQ